MARVKVCGMTNREDAVHACECGADAVGFIFYQESSRYIKPEDAKGIIEKLPPFTTTVGVFVNEATARIAEIKRITGIDAVQLHGDESPEVCEAVDGKVIKVFRVRRREDLRNLENYQRLVSSFLLDTYSKSLYGGTGEAFDWEFAAYAKKYGNIILAGGLTPENVAEAVKKARPYAVDVATGVEERPGKKDPEKVREFIKRAKGAI